MTIDMMLCVVYGVSVLGSMFGATFYGIAVEYARRNSGHGHDSAALSVYIASFSILPLLFITWLIESVRMKLVIAPSLWSPVIIMALYVVTLLLVSKFAKKVATVFPQIQASQLY